MTRDEKQAITAEKFDSLPKEERQAILDTYFDRLVEYIKVRREKETQEWLKDVHTEWIEQVGTIERVFIDMFNEEE